MILPPVFETWGELALAMAVLYRDRPFPSKFRIKNQGKSYLIDTEEVKYRSWQEEKEAEIFTIYVN